jgi:hypothetical protein
MSNDEVSHDACRKADDTLTRLKALAIGETLRVESTVDHIYLRVPGGWIVTRGDGFYHSVFVPIPVSSSVTINR